MNKYELALVISTKIEDEEKEAVLGKVKDLIAKASGTVGEIDDRGKKEMAYEIQDMKYGFYYFIQFEAPATAPAKIEAALKIMDNVIRFLVVKPDAE